MEGQRSLSLWVLGLSTHPMHPQGQPNWGFPDRN